MNPPALPNKSRCPSLADSQRQRGFALVLVLALIAVMVVLVVYFAMMTQVESQTAATTARHLEAKQNALLGLEVAVGQLQQYAGKDQAATFPATTFYPEKDVTAGTGELYDGGSDLSQGFRDFAQTSSSRSYLSRVETYLTPNERDSWETAIRDYWNNGGSPRNPHWTGIMDTALRVDRFTNPASPAALPDQRYEDDPSTLHGEPKRDQLPIWLISGNEMFHDSGTFDPASATSYPAGYTTPDTPLGDPASDNSVVYLVGGGSATTESDSIDGLDGRVRAPKQDIVEEDGSGNSETVGHYAYWVADESIKANFAIRDPYWDASVNTVEYRNRLQTPQRIGWENITGFDDATFEANDDRLAYLNTAVEISLLEDTNIESVEEASKENFHSLTAFSESLLTDTSRGGLKKDLTYYLQGGAAPLGYQDGDAISDPDAYSGNDPRFAAFGGGNNGFPNSLNNVPTWGQLKDWYQNEAAGNNSTLTPSNDIAPVITYINLHSGYSFDPATGEILVHYIPAVVLWNPWDVGLSQATYEIDLGHNIRHWYFQAGSSGVDPADVTLADANSDGLTDNPNDSGTFWNNLVNPSGTSPENRWFYYALEEVDNGWTNDNGSTNSHFRSQSTPIGGSRDSETVDIGSGAELAYRFDLMVDNSSGNNMTDDDGEDLGIDKTMKFQVTSSFGPGESKIFTLGSDPSDSTVDWEPSQRLVLQNVFDPDFPASASFPLMRIKNNAPTANASADSGLTREIHWRAGNLGSSKPAPYVRFALSGNSDPISETFSVGFVQYNHVDNAHEDDTDQSPSAWARTIPATDHFADNMVPQNTDDAGAAYPMFRVWLQPFTSTPGSWGIDTNLGGGAQDALNLNYAGFSRFNLSRSADLNQLIERNRGAFDGNNVDALHSMVSYYRGKPSAPGGQLAWDENQYNTLSSGITKGYSLISYSNEPGDELLGLSDLSIRNAKRASSEIVSLGQLQQANLSPFIWQPSFPIGNAEAPAYVDREAIGGIQAREIGEVINLGWNNPNPDPWKSHANDVDNRLLDVSYLLNESLWDRYFLSTIPQTGSVDFQDPLPNGRHRFRTDIDFNNSEVRDYDTASAYLTNVGALNVNSTSVEAWKALLTAFRDLKIQPQSGTENPDETVPVSRSLDPITGQLGFHFDESEHGARVDADFGNVGSGKDLTKVVSGFRYMDDQMIEALAERIVDEVRLRGPFLSLADFVNRRLVGPEGSGNSSSAWYQARTNGALGASNDNHNDFMDPSYDPFIGLQGLNGALQRAINVSGINGGVNHPQYGDDGSSSGDSDDWVYGLRIRDSGGADNTTGGNTNSGIGGTANTRSKIAADPAIRHYLDSEHLAGAPVGEAGSQLLGAPGHITQGDLLSMIGPALTPRGDTFLIRTYGDVVNPATGEVQSQVWLEAVVQRVADPVTPAGTSGEDRWRPTDRYGRKFEVVNFRWLTPDEV